MHTKVWCGWDSFSWCLVPCNALVIVIVTVVPPPLAKRTKPPSFYKLLTCNLFIRKQDLQTCKFDMYGWPLEIHLKITIAIINSRVKGKKKLKEEETSRKFSCHWSPSIIFFLKSFTHPNFPPVSFLPFHGMGPSQFSFEERNQASPSFDNAILRKKLTCIFIFTYHFILCEIWVTSLRILMIFSRQDKSVPFKQNK